MRAEGEILDQIVGLRRNVLFGPDAPHQPRDRGAVIVEILRRHDLLDAEPSAIGEFGFDGAAEPGDALVGGLAFGKSLLGYVFDEAFRLDAEGWKKLTFRWGLFFLFLAALNEIVWRSFSEDTWLYFKVWGTIPITVIFTLSQMPLIQKHSLTEDDGPAS